MEIKMCPTYEATIYICGEPHMARQALREAAVERGLCVTVTPCDFVFTGGMESGVAIGLRNYPRFPETDGTIRERAQHLASLLIEQMCQKTAMIVWPGETVWMSRSDDFR